tara:strand:- start:5350 stop:5499 length:150 start_codon:yes stop_codon:yes gene_type:complete
MTKHIAYDIVIVVLVVAGLAVDGFQLQDGFFALATVIWVWQKEIEELLK